MITGAPPKRLRARPLAGPWHVFSELLKMLGFPVALVGCGG